jgi:hypothetical protein
MLTFLLCILGLVLVALIVNRIGGAKAHYTETLALDPGERVLWEDAAADAYPVLQQRALHVSFRRSRRRHVLVTTRRIVVGAKTLWGSKHLLQYVLHPADGEVPPEADSLGGGLTRRGFVSLIFERAPLDWCGTGPAAYLDLQLSPTAASSANIACFRIYTTHGASFVLPAREAIS